MEDTGSIIITSTIPVFGNIIYMEDERGASEALQYVPSNTLYCPGFFQDDDWDTWICINNIANQVNTLSCTYLDSTGVSLTTTIKILAPHATTFFRPSDDGVSTNFGSVIISSTLESSLVGYVFKNNLDGGIAYTYSLLSEMHDLYGAPFLTLNNSVNELVFFNPDAVGKNLDVTFSDDEGTLISTEYFTVTGLGSLRIEIEEYAADCYGSVKIESNLNGVVGCYGFYNDIYGFGNSMKITVDDHYYISYMVSGDDATSPTEDADTYPYVGLCNPESGEKTYELVIYDRNDEFNDAHSGTVTLSGGGVAESPIAGGFYGAEATQISTPLSYGWGEMEFETPYPSGPSVSATPDSDHDRLPDHIENIPVYWANTMGKWYDPDTDDDGMRDGYEYYQITPMAVRFGLGIYGPAGDCDSDGFENQFEYAIWQGLKFLKKIQAIPSLVDLETPPETIYFDNGEFPGYEWKVTDVNKAHNPFNCNFHNMFILHSLIHLESHYNNLDGWSQTMITSMMNKLETFLIDIKMPDPNTQLPKDGIVWDFYGDGSGMYFNDKQAAPDVDDTVNALQVLDEMDVDIDSYYPGTNAADYMDKFLTSRNNKEFFLTFIRQTMPGYNDVDSVLNANALWFYISQGKENLVSDIPDYLDYWTDLLILTSGAIFGSLMYYETCPYSYVYALTRAYAEYASSPAILTGGLDEDLMDFLIGNNYYMGQKSDGHWDAYHQGSHSSDTFETALATISLMNLKVHLYSSLSSTKQTELDTAIDKGIDYIMSQKNMHKGDDANSKVCWPFGGFFLNPVAEDGGLIIYMGSDSFTTALCLEAIAMYH